MKAGKRKQIAFDIDTDVAKLILGESNYQNIYKKIEKVFDEKHWKHIQGSVYVSREPISKTKVVRYINELVEKYPYIKKCMRDIRQTEVGRVDSLNKYFDYDGTAGVYAQKNADKGNDKAKSGMQARSMEDWTKHIAERRNAARATGTDGKIVDFGKKKSESKYL